MRVSSDRGDSANLRSIPPADYACLPTLLQPAAYICVIRDVDSDRYRIQATNQPRWLIEAAFAERTREFGIELLSILESDNIAESEARLFERHHATLSADWLALDTYQLRELQKSDLQVNAHRSQYISPDEMQGLEYEQPTNSDLPQWQGRSPQLAPEDRLDEAQRSNPQSTLGSNRYGAHSHRRCGRLLFSSELESDQSRRSIRQAIDEAITDLWTDHPWKCLAALALVVLFCLATVDLSCSPYGGCPDTRSATTDSFAGSSSSTQQAAAKPGPTYRVLRAVTARECPAQNCPAVSRLSDGAEIRSLGFALGDKVDGSANWVRFKQNGETVFVPRKLLSLIR